MSMVKILDKIFKNAKKIVIDDKSNIVIMSDCHRGDGNTSDNFNKNKNIFQAALSYYFDKGFTYIELGDGDDLWEVRNCRDIINIHLDTFKKLKKFNDENRLFMIYGNHDIVKKSKVVFNDCFGKYYDEEKKIDVSLLNSLSVQEALILNYKEYDIFLIHGHQVDLLNGKMWKLSRFLVRHIWKNLEGIGTNDPTKVAKNYSASKSVEKKLKKWSNINNKIVISGHTHRPIFSDGSESLYFNDGSCVHPNGITCIEIVNGNISLVGWQLKVKDDGSIFASRYTIKGEKPIMDFFKKKN